MPGGVAGERPSWPPPMPISGSLSRNLAIIITASTIGYNTIIMPNVVISAELKIGSRRYIGSGAKMRENKDPCRAGL